MKLLKKLFAKQKKPSPPRSVSSTAYGGRGEREIQIKLELLVNVTDKDRRDIFEIAKKLTAFNMIDQDRFIDAIAQFYKYPELMYHLCKNGIIALHKLDSERWEQWLSQVRKQLETNGEQSAIRFVKRIKEYIEAATPPSQEVSLRQIRPTLEMFLTGLSGNTLKLAENEVAYTDTETIYLPPTHSVFPTQQENANFYKVLLTYLWAQTAYGTWQMDIARFLYEHSDPDKAIALYQVLETLRLDACIERELPGIFRLAKQFGNQQSRLPDTKEWQTISSKLKQVDASNQDSLQLLETIYTLPAPTTAIYQGRFMPQEVNRAIRHRSAANQEELKEALTRLLEQSKSISKRQTDETYTLKFHEQLSNDQSLDFILMQDDAVVEIPEHIQDILERIVHDLGEVPPDYLQLDSQTPPDKASAKATKDISDEPGIVMKLPEWDHATQRYRPDWCSIRFRQSEHGASDFASRTRAKHCGMVRRLNHTFEALREANRVQKRQASGDEIDIDATVESLVDHLATHNEFNNDIYTRINKSQRDVAVMFMVDTSSSTHGMVNRVEKEALILLCDSLKHLGDRYAVFGFSGKSRKSCKLCPIKEFDEVYDSRIEQRIAGITAEGYTRIGAAVRYLTNQLFAIQAKTKLLVVISDGKPDDVDGYRSRYGIEDTRRALLEARTLGIASYCLTIDKEARNYLPYMYGHTHYSIISRVEELPFKMADIYRRITT